MKKQKTDKTSKERQARRRAALDRIARGLGFQSWSELETEALRDTYKLPRRSK